MSMPHSKHHEGESRSGFHDSPCMVPSSGFLTPPSPYNLEARRDSVASSQSSMSSFISCMSEYSVPVTPACTQSPLAVEGFVDMAYELSQEYQGQSMHGIPSSQPPKIPGPDRGNYGSWQMTAAFHQNQSLPFQSQLMGPIAGNIMQPPMADHTELESAMITAINPSWESLTSILSEGMGQQWTDRNLHIVPEDNMQMFWTGDMTQSHDVMMQATTPLGAIVGMDSDCIHVDPGSFISPESLGNLTPSFAPSTPQEVCFKRETSPPLKHESDSEDASPQLSRSIYVSSTGGKSVKKERRSSTQSKRSSRVKKLRDRNPILRGEIVDGKFDGVECKLDEATGEYRWYGTRPPSQAKQRCPYKDEHGNRCPRAFARPEHLKRHRETTHSGIRIFPCAICTRKFNRNDNCQEHMWTHVRRPGKKDGRNEKMSLSEVEQFCTDPINGPKLIEKMRMKWRKEVELLEFQQDSP